MATTQTLSQPLGRSARRYVFMLALPAVGEQLLNTAVGLTDVYLVGNLSAQAQVQLGYSSTTAQASAGLANQMMWLATMLFIAFGIGSTALVARASGAKNWNEVQQTLRQSMLVAFGIGTVTMLFVMLMARPFLLMLNAPAEVVPHGEQYLQIVALSLIPTALLFIGNACLRGIGDTRMPLYVMMGVNGTNILLSWLFVDGNLDMPILGVNGAALGTAIGRSGGGIIVVLLLLRGRSGLQLSPKLQPDTSIIRRVLRVGLPSAGEMMAFQGALLIFTTFVTGLGTVAYATHSVTINIESLSFLPGLGYAAAASTLVGQGLGARSPRLSEEYAYEALWQGGLMMTLAGVLMISMPAQLLGIFTNDPAVIAAGITPLRAAGLVQPALAVGFILAGGLRGAGDTRWPLYSRLITSWAIRLPLALFVVHILDLGLLGIWLAMCTDFTIQGLMIFWRFQSGRWKKIEV